MPVSIYVSDFFFLESNHLPAVGPLQNTAPEQGRNALSVRNVHGDASERHPNIRHLFKVYVGYSETTQSCRQTPAGPGSQRASGAASALTREHLSRPGRGLTGYRLCGRPSWAHTLTEPHPRQALLLAQRSEMGRQPALQEWGEQDCHHSSSKSCLLSQVR